MKPDQIRQDGIECHNAHQASTNDEYHLRQIGFMLSEIAAQLAEFNQNIKLLAPSIFIETDEEPTYTDADIAEQVKHRETILKSPTSDPDKFVWCCDCLKEVPRPEHCKVGDNIICDSCMPF